MSLLACARARGRSVPGVAACRQHVGGTWTFTPLVEACKRERECVCVRARSFQLGVPSGKGSLPPPLSPTDPLPGGEDTEPRANWAGQPQGGR